jgi:hypothetical protein
VENGLTGPGQVGDIRQPDSPQAAAEFDEARAECEEEWDHLATAFGTPLKGPIAFNMRRFVDVNGNPTSSLGLGSPPYEWTGPPPGPIPPPCQIPPSITAAEGAFLGVVDFDAIRAPNGNLDPARDARVVGHELGHVLNLGHGNGLDDNGNGTFDEFCDAGESGRNEPRTIMYPTDAGTSLVTTLQRETGRVFARSTPGGMIDPPMDLIGGDARGDFRADSTNEVRSASVDITGVSMIVNAERGHVIVSHRLLGPVSMGNASEHVAFLDLDGDPTTGGRPAELGFAAEFEGAELVTRVSVDGQSATSTAWHFDDNAFAEMGGDSTTATVEIPEGNEEIPFPAYSVVATHLTTDAVGPVGEEVRLQATSSVVGGAEVDTLPGEEDGPISSGDSVILYMTHPNFPVCSAVPDLLQPGGTVTLEATGFDRSGTTTVLLGGMPIAVTDLDETGSAAIDVAVPEDAATGMRLITIELDDTTLTAECGVRVEG